MINLRAEIATGEGGFRHEGLSRTVCRILSLYNLTPLLQKLRETEGKDGEKERGARVFARKDETTTKIERRRESRIDRMR